jgi:trehalose 6-phosphate phosphatase
VSLTAGKAGNTSKLLAALREDPQSTGIFCDIDGTLAPIVERAEDARVPPDTSELLGSLAGRYALVGCLSGRRATAARELVGRDDLVYIGNHGFERLLPGKADAELDPAIHDHAADASAFLDHHVAPGELEAIGLRREDKGPIQTLHWRGAADEATAEASARELAMEAIERNLFAHWGRKVLEIRPAVELSKGTALAELLEERELTAALYAGDDRTDVDAFRTLHGMIATGDLRAAVCIGIASAEGPREISQEADAVVEDPAAFVALLRLLE